MDKELTMDSQKLSRTELDRKKKLVDLRHMLNEMKNPQDSTRYIHLAGTNGKGSTSAMLASIFQQAGYRTGLFISPHISSVYERIQVDGKPIEAGEFYILMQFVKLTYANHGLKVSSYAQMAATGFLYFQKCKCDIVILETGLGGENDPTNAIRNTEAAVFTNIGLDHIPSLGTSIEEIAANKSHIIKQGCDVILYPSDTSVLKIIEKACETAGTDLYQADFSKLIPHRNDQNGQVFDYRDREGLEIKLLGEHQLCNAAVALDTIDIMRKRGWPISEKAIRNGLRCTYWPCRLEIIRRNPPVILDVVTNSLGAIKFRAAMNQYFPQKRITLILGSLDYKRYLDMYDLLLDTADHIVTVTASGSSGRNAFALAQGIGGRRKKIYACDSILDGAWLAEKLCGDDGVIAGVGTFHIMTELKRYFAGGEGEMTQ